MRTIQPTTTTFNAIKSLSNLKVEKPFTPPSDLISHTHGHMHPIPNRDPLPLSQKKAPRQKANLFPRNFVSHTQEQKKVTSFLNVYLR